MTTMIDIKGTQISVKELFCTLLKHFNTEHSNFLEVLRSLSIDVKHEKLSLTEMIDVGCLLRGIEKNIDEMRKDAKAHKEMIEKVTCYRLSVEDRESCRGSLATGTLKAKYHSNAPHPVREPEKFIKLCEFFGINTDKIPLGMVRFHWPTIKQYVSHCMEVGIELPDELSDVNVELGITYRLLANGKDE